MKWSAVPDPALAEPISVREAAAPRGAGPSGIARSPAPSGSPRSKGSSRSAWIRVGGGSSAIGRTRAVRCTSTSAPRTRSSTCSTTASCSSSSATSSGSGGRSATRRGWASLVHRIIEDCEKGTVERTLEGLDAEVDERWRPQEFPAKAVSEAWRSLAQKTDAPQLVRAVRRASRLGHGGGFEFDYDGCDDRRVHRPDRTRPRRVPGHADHGLQDRQRRSRLPRRTRASSWASTTSRSSNRRT